MCFCSIVCSHDCMSCCRYSCIWNLCISCEAIFVLESAIRLLLLLLLQLLYNDNNQILHLHGYSNIQHKSSLCNHYHMGTIVFTSYFFLSSVRIVDYGWLWPYCPEVSLFCLGSVCACVIKQWSAWHCAGHWDLFLITNPANIQTL